MLSTFTHRSCELADNELIFKPQSDLAILNYICNYIIQNDAVNKEFVAKNVNFNKGVTDIGYGLRPNHPLEQVAMNNGYPGADGKPKGNPNKSTPITFDEFEQFVSEYTLDNAPRFPACRRRSWRRWPRPTPIRRPRSSRTGPWASTSTPAAPG